MLVIKTMADSPGNPIIENTGKRYPEIIDITPQYCNKLIARLIGMMIFKSHHIVLPALGNAFIMLLLSLLSEYIQKWWGLK